MSFASLIVFVSSVLACHFPIAPPPLGPYIRPETGPGKSGHMEVVSRPRQGMPPPCGSAYPRPAHVVISVRFPKGCTDPTSPILFVVLKSLRKSAPPLPCRWMKVTSHPTPLPSLAHDDGRGLRGGPPRSPGQRRARGAPPPLPASRQRRQ